MTERRRWASRTSPRVGSARRGSARARVQPRSRAILARPKSGLDAAARRRCRRQRAPARARRARAGGTTRSRRRHAASGSSSLWIQVAPLDHQAHVVARRFARVLFRGGDGPARGARDAPLHPAHRRVEVRAPGTVAALAGVRARGGWRRTRRPGRPGARRKDPPCGTASRRSARDARREAAAARRVRALARLDEPPEQKQTPRSAVFARRKRPS